MSDLSKNELQSEVNSFICDIASENFEGFFDSNTDISDNFELLAILQYRLEEAYKDVIIDDKRLYEDIKTINDLVDIVMEYLV
ncbi:MAG: hypothetical protein A3F91_09725 [Flavobacteria bacterium RIFCSPLOWO2_12_FULL_35_11]|nr:MAG: hypothetical protein A3F91_09725 [Flavobacteria bacterium RIFCSPLOWO2_12_FULL_35_11]